MRRKIGIVSAAVAAMAGLLGSATPSSADITPQVVRPFSCAGVVASTGNGTPEQWGRHCTGDAFVVGRNQSLCVAVTGSAGHGIMFRAYQPVNGPNNDIWRGRVSAELVVGAPRDCMFRNLGAPVTVQLKARSHTVFGVNVQATGYVV